ncbi:MAG: DNA mismatch repair endonuclease MutL, partial [Chloroflexi bacterium]|nr:DNA mismatch repair endonuclease MutL [Chloroflexota bacterium]
MTIRVLPPEVAARIAAGEVVERPASVVKELVENALDAGASRISIEVAGGGIDSIRVTDDGCGIGPEELELAFARHATSKLDQSDDLSRILTLGFRGEALPSIAAVAEVEMLSRPPGAEAAAYRRLAPEAPPQGGSRGAPVGTSVTVRRLFARQPARRKFLRSPASETNALTAVVTHYALAYPEVRFSLSLDGRQTLSTPGSGDRRDAVAAVYGAELAAAMLPVGAGRGNTGPLAEACPEPVERVGGLISVEGLIAPPHISRAGRGYVSLFVNRRWIQSRRLTYAVEEAYQGMLMSGRHPVAVLHLRVPYEDVDVNVHPTKAEVRFRDESAVFAAVQRAVRPALTEGSPVPRASGVAAPPLTLAPQATTPPLWQHAVSLARRDTGHETRDTSGQRQPPTPAQALPVLRVIGQFGSTYVIAEGPDGMYLIDQHAAHERVLY